MAKTKRETAMDFLGGLGDDLDSAPRQHLSPAELMPDPEQPRKTFNEEGMANLEAGIKSDGILQPLLVRESGTTPPYIITDGERRWRIASKLQLAEIPVLIRNDIDANRLRFVQAMANVNRENLSDYELATVIQQQLDENPKLKQKDMARQLGISPATVTRLLALLDPEYVDLAKAGMIESASALAQLKKLDDAARASLLDAASQGQVITREAVDERRTEAAAQAAALASAVMSQANEPSETSTEPGNTTEGGIDDLQLDDVSDPIETPATGQADADTSMATPRAKPEGMGKAPANASVKLTLKIEDVELLIPYFVDKEVEKLDIKMSQDTAIGLLEKLGQPAPAELADYPNAIKDGIQNLLSS